MSRLRDTQQEVQCTSNRKLTEQFSQSKLSRLGRLIFFLYILAD